MTKPTLSKADILFGKIAVSSGYVTEDQLDDCIRFQESLQEHKPLGLIMQEKDIITEEQLQVIIDIQRKNLQERAIHTREKRSDGLFGRIVLQLGFATPQQVHECVRIQAKVEDDLFLRLGEILVKKAYLTVEQVEKVLDYQKMRIVCCRECQTQYNVIMFRPGAQINCYKCGSTLSVPEKLNTVAAERTIQEDGKPVADGRAGKGKKG